jgi:hypothetical protein
LGDAFSKFANVCLNAFVLVGSFAMDVRHKLVAMSLLGKTIKESDDYHLALGRFIAEYAMLETTLRSALWHLSRLKAPMAQVLLSGVRTDAAISNINRISEAKKWPDRKKKQWKFVSDQIQDINLLRNSIVHHGAALQADGTWLSSNKKVVHVPEKATNRIVRPEILDQARSDLFSIRLCVAFFAWGNRFPPHMRLTVKQTLSGAWQYKPAPQGRKANTNRKDRQKQ